MTSNKSGGKGFSQDWDAIDGVNGELYELADSVKDRGVGYAGEAEIKPEHFGKLDGSSTAAQGAEEAFQQLGEAMTSAGQALDTFVQKTKAAVDQHKGSDAAAEDDYMTIRSAT